MLRLRTWRWPSARETTSGHCILVFPDSTEDRWFDRIPTPGTGLRSRRVQGYWGRTWVVNEVLQSGKDTYTVFLVDRREYARNLRDREGDLAAELVELARRANESVNETRRRRQNRDYLP
jgi:hypothetical protein